MKWLPDEFSQWLCFGITIEKKRNRDSGVSHYLLLLLFLLLFFFPSSPSSWHHSDSCGIWTCFWLISSFSFNNTVISLEKQRTNLPPLPDSSWADRSIWAHETKGPGFIFPTKMLLSCVVSVPWSIPWAAVPPMCHCIQWGSVQTDLGNRTAPAPFLSKWLGVQSLLKAGQEQCLCVLEAVHSPSSVLGEGQLKPPCAAATS